MPNELLPVGSVVRLEDADAFVMVIGFKPTFDDVEADYLGVIYPQGLVSDDAALAFDADTISEVVFRGYWDEEGEAARAALRRYRDAALDLKAQFEAFVETLTPDRVIELRSEYIFDQMDEEPEPDFPDEGELA